MPKISRLSKGVAQEAQNLSPGEDVNAYPGTATIMSAMTGVPKFPAPAMLAKLAQWAGKPQTHIVGLFLSLLAALAVVAFAIATLEYTKMRGKLLLTAFLVAGYFMTMLTATGTPKDRVIRWLYVSIFGFATMALFLLIVGVWTTPDSDEFWRLAASVTFVAFGLSIVGRALGLDSGGRKSRFLTWATAVLAASLTMMTVLGIALGIKAETYWWTFVLLALCWLFSSAALVSARLWRRRNADRADK